MRIMGIDLGEKRIGIALSDLTGMIACNSFYILRKDDNKTLREILNSVVENEVDKIVVGLPLNMDGSSGPQAKKVMEFIESLKKYISLPIFTWDERWSTLSAQRVLIDADVSRKKRKKLVDKVSAVIILQSYLDSLAQNEG